MTESAPRIVEIGLHLAWLCVLVYWVWAARAAKKASRTEPFFKRLLGYWLPLVLAFVLLGPGDWYGDHWLREQFVPHHLLVYSIGLALCAAGAAVAILSRHHLGRDWSATVQVKREHTLIRTGPYRFVRHPIYTGLLMLFLGNALIVGDWRGLFAMAIVFVSFWHKLGREEQWLSVHFGEAYNDYRRRTRKLIPFIL